MATLALYAVGSAIGGSVGGTIFGVGAAAIGGAIGSAVGTFIDGSLFGGVNSQQQAPERLENLKLTTSTEGTVIPRVHGVKRIGGNVIWATDFVELLLPTGGGGKGGPQVSGGSEYFYYVSFAVALSQGPVTGIHRAWADGKLLDLSGFNWRLYQGTATQDPDPLIISKMGADSTPAYRGTAYIVFENMPLKQFGNRFPQISFEVIAPLAAPDIAENLIGAVAMIPGSGEFVLATTPAIPFSGAPENQIASKEKTDFVVSLDYLQTVLPNLQTVHLVVGWYGNDLRAGNCALRPLAREAAGFRTTVAGWTVNARGRGVDPVVSTFDGAPAYGGTPDDGSVLEAIAEIKSRGLGIVFHPFIFMDIPAGNVLPNPYSDNASASGQPVYPWRGRITISPAAGFAGSVDKTATAGSQVSSFFGAATPGLFKEVHGPLFASATATPAGSQEEETATLIWSDKAPAGFKGESWSLDDVIGGVTHPVKIVSTETTAAGKKQWNITPRSGSWSASVIAARKNGALDVKDFTTLYIGSAEDSFRRMILHYALLCKMAGGVNGFLIGSELPGLTTARSDASTYPMVAAMTALAADVRTVLGAETKISYGADWSEYFGHQPVDGTSDVFFHLDPFWADGNIDFVGIDNYMPISDWRDGVEHLDAQTGVPAIYDRTYLDGNIEGGEYFDWFYANQNDWASQTRTAITDGTYGEPWVFRPKDLAGWWANSHFNRPGGVKSATPTAWVAESKSILFTEFGCAAIDRGTNAPAQFVDPKSSESGWPPGSRGMRDDAIQRLFLETTLRHWKDISNNPVSTVTGLPMVSIDTSAVWAWDARPYPWFPSSEKWADAPNYRVGHWIAGRVGAASLGGLVEQIMTDAGLAPELVDVDDLRGHVEGYVIAAIESARVSLSPLARHFGFDAVESDGRIKFTMRGKAPVATVTLDDVVVTRDQEGEAVEFQRDQEGELPRFLKWRMEDPEGDHSAFQVEAAWLDFDSKRVTIESFAFAVPVEEAHQRVNRALAETWTEIEKLTLALPPSMLALDPADVISLTHDGRSVDYRITEISDGEARSIVAVRSDREISDLRILNAETRAAAAVIVVPGVTDAIFLNVPRIADVDTDFRAKLAVTANPWLGDAVAWAAIPAETPEYVQVILVPTQSSVGTLVADLGAGPTLEWDRGSVLDVEITGAQLVSVSDLALFNGANRFAVESAPGIWEIVQGGDVEIVSAGRYKVTHLLRGRRGSEWAIGDPTPAGSRVVLLDDRVSEIPLGLGAVGIELLWRVGPSDQPIGDARFDAETFTVAGEGLMPFAPTTMRMARDATGNLLLSWQRRDRNPAAENWNLTTPMSESSENYEVDILSPDGTVVHRTMTGLTALNVTYTAADQIIDFGSTQNVLRWRVAQIGSLGRGHAAEDTVPVTFAI